MKYIVLVIALFVLTKCTKPWKIEQIIENNTAHSIKIETFYDGKEKELISIAPNKSYNQIQLKESQGTSDLFLFKTQVDSLNILFDEKKIIVQSCNNNSLYYCPDISRNLFDLFKEYVEEDLGKHSLRYTYTITEEDYNRAVTIQE